MTAATPFIPRQDPPGTSRGAGWWRSAEPAAAVTAVHLFSDLLWSPVAAFTLDGLAARAGDTFPTWAIARVSNDDWTMVASTGDVQSPVGTTMAWEESLCSQLQFDAAAVLAGDFRRVRGRAVRTRAKSYRVRSYIGAPLLAGDGTRLGSLCACSAAPPATTRALEPTSPSRRDS